MFYLKKSLLSANKAGGMRAPLAVSVTLLKNKLLPFVLGLPLFFCLHHYAGIVFDARLYLLQVVHNIHPERFLNDPPFMFGNQDSYGLFSLFYGAILKAFPIDKSAFILTFLGQGLWILACFFLFYQFTKRMGFRLWYSPLILLFIIYSGKDMPNDHVFFWAFVEQFNVSRFFSLTIAILGLGLLIANRKQTSLAFFLFGTAIHPLTAGWCLPLWLFFYYPKTRIPIAIISMLFPITFLLHKGPFDVYPVDWGNCTHDHPITFVMLWREAVACFFFGVFIPKFTNNKKLLTFAKAVFGVLLAGFYWSATGGIAKHILIYQVQTWRVEWLFFVLAFPFFAYIVYEQIQLFRHGKTVCFTTSHASLLMMGYAIFTPAPQNIAFIGAVCLLFIRTRQWNLRSSLLSVSFLCIISAGIHELIKISLAGLIKFSLINFQDLFEETNNLLHLQNLLIIGIVVFCTYHIAFHKTSRRKMWFIPLFLLIYLICPQFQLLPVAVTFLFFYREKTINVKFLIPLLLLCLLDSFFNTDFRPSKILAGFLGKGKDSLIYVIPVLSWISLFFLNISKISRRLIILSSVLVLSIIAVIGYDERTSSVKLSEYRLNFFKDETIFPNIQNRGKMFYYVLGDYTDESRTQFLTGSYFSETTPIGEALFQGQFEEERKRLNYIFFKEQRGFIAKRNQWRQFVKDSLSHKSLLFDRVNYLCSIDEITHFVSNLRFQGLDKQDSYKMSDYETIYLYGCPNAKN